MGNIKVLHKNLANMIAAGEVVERPASVIKELIENSIDGAATNITVEIRNGGKTYMRVTDDGYGMIMEDARMAFRRHATSKISREADLFKIYSYGFRGEALAAISAVSKVEMLTSTSSDVYGTKIIVEGGEEICCDEIGVPSGTTVIVRDLFYNTPARLNFLKKDSTESAAIISVVEKFALCNTNKSFKLIVDDKIVLNTDASSEQLDTIHAILGGDICDNFVPIEYLENEVCLTGYVAYPKCNRSNRNFQFCFVNGRIVRNKTVTAAIDKAYHNSLMKGRHAVVLLKINVPCENIDVNVHPTKMEVKFLNESKVFEVVYYSIKNALEKEDQINDKVSSYFATDDPLRYVRDERAYTEEAPKEVVLKFDLNTMKYDKVHKSDFAIQKDDYIKSVSENNYSWDSLKSLYDGGFSSSRFTTLDEDELSNAFDTDFQDNSYMFAPEIPFTFIGEIFKTYIIIESGSSYFLIDKHAAHERIIFNKICEKYKNEENYCQTLLSGVPVTLSPEEADIVRSNVEKLSKLGYLFDEFGDFDIILRTIPFMISSGDIVASFLDTVAILNSHKKSDITEFENATLKMFACRAAIKAGFDSSKKELEKLISQLLSDGSINYCPHGRPIICEYTKEDVEKDFKRIV